MENDDGEGGKNSTAAAAVDCSDPDPGEKCSSGGLEEGELQDHLAPGAREGSCEEEGRLVSDPGGIGRAEEGGLHGELEEGDLQDVKDAGEETEGVPEDPGGTGRAGEDDLHGELEVGELQDVKDAGEESEGVPEDPGGKENEVKDAESEAGGVPGPDTDGAKDSGDIGKCGGGRVRKLTEFFNQIGDKGLVKRREDPDFPREPPRTPGRVKKTRTRAGGGHRLTRKKTREQEDSERKMAMAMRRFLAQNTNQELHEDPENPD